MSSGVGGVQSRDCPLSRYLDLLLHTGFSKEGMASQSVSSKLTFHRSQPTSVRMRLSKDATSGSGHTEKNSC